MSLHEPKVLTAEATVLFADPRRSNLSLASRMAKMSPLLWAFFLTAAQRVARCALCGLEGWAEVGGATGNDRGSAGVSILGGWMAAWNRPGLGRTAVLRPGSVLGNNACGGAEDKVTQVESWLVASGPRRIKWRLYSRFTPRYDFLFNRASAK